MAEIVGSFGVSHLMYARCVTATTRRRMVTGCSRGRPRSVTGASRIQEEEEEPAAAG